MKEKECTNDFDVDSGLIRLVIEKLFILFFFLDLGLYYVGYPGTRFEYFFVRFSHGPIPALILPIPGRS